MGARLQAAGDAFLEVERYVNLNVTAVRKLLKKHDKVLPERPCAAFYTARMHDMRWVRNDYSDVVVRLSRLYAARAPAARGGKEEARGDEQPQHHERLPLVATPVQDSARGGCEGEALVRALRSTAATV